MQRRMGFFGLGPGTSESRDWGEMFFDALAKLKLQPGHRRTVHVVYPSVLYSIRLGRRPPRRQRPQALCREAPKHQQRGASSPAGRPLQMLRREPRPSFSSPRAGIVSRCMWGARATSPPIAVAAARAGRFQGEGEAGGTLIVALSNNPRLTDDTKTTHPGGELNAPMSRPLKTTMPTIRPIPVARRQDRRSPDGLTYTSASRRASGFTMAPRWTPTP